MKRNTYIVDLERTAIDSLQMTVLAESVEQAEQFALDAIETDEYWKGEWITGENTGDPIAFAKVLQKGI